MAGIQLSALVDLFLGTSQAVLTGENFIRNETAPRNTLLRQIMKSHDMEEMLQGGDMITDQVMFDEDSTYGPYNVLEPKAPRLSNHMTELSVQWALSDAHVTFSKHEKGFNMASQLNRGARAMVFKKIIKAKWSNLFVSINKGMDRELMAQPNNGTMETVTTGTRVPYSIWCAIHTFGATAASPTATVNPGFTTFQTVPSTQALWRNPVEFYRDGKAEIAGPAAAAGNPQGWDGFLAFTTLYDRLSWEELAIRPEYGETVDPECFIICSQKGKRLVQYASQRNQDFTRHGTDSVTYPGMGNSGRGGINFEGVPIKWIERMDTAVVWPDAAGTGFAGENDATLDENGVAAADPDTQGPRFVFIAPKFWKKIVHSEHFLEEETPPASVSQPYLRTVFFDCWHQNWCHSRQKAGGVVAPFPGGAGDATLDIDGFI